MKCGSLHCAILFEHLLQRAGWREKEKDCCSRIHHSGCIIPSEISPPLLQRGSETCERQGQAELLWVLQYLPERFQPDASWWENKHGEAEQISLTELVMLYGWAWCSRWMMNWLFVSVDSAAHYTPQCVGEVEALLIEFISTAATRTLQWHVWRFV